MAFSTRIVRVSDGWVLDGPVWLHEPPPKGNLEWSDVVRILDIGTTLPASRHRNFALGTTGTGTSRLKACTRYSGSVPTMTAEVPELERILAETADESEFAIVRYEWESGLND